MLYTTVAKLKKFLGGQATESDGPYQELLETATELIDTELGENLEVKTRTRRIDGSGTSRVIMETRVNSVAYVKDYRTGSPYVVDFIDGAIVYLTSEVERGQKNIEIQYSIGYAEVPKDLEMYFLEYCKSLWERNQITSDTEVVKTKKLGDLSVTYFSPSELAIGESILATPQMEKILKKYKHFTIYPIL